MGPTLYAKRGLLSLTAILLAGRADLVCLARPHLSDPYWTLHAAVQLRDTAASWPDPYLAVLDVLVIVSNECCVRPSLVGRMSLLAYAPSHEGLDDRVLLRAGRLRPLLQFDDYRVVTAGVVSPGQNEVDAVRGQWNLILDGHVGIIGRICRSQHIVHVLHGVTPGFYLAGTGGVTEFVFESGEDLGIDSAGDYVFGETGFC